MAISETHYRALKTLCDRGEIVPLCTLLEIGEANWYGDIEPDFPILDIHSDYPLSFATAKAAYTHLFDPIDWTAIDAGGTPEAKRLDLNQPINLGTRFDLIINHGTAEHIFNIANVFKVAHDHCKLGGLMIHESPFTGWVDHGFYCLQPTLFYDVAAANDYDIRYLAIEHIESKELLEISCLKEPREHIHRMARRAEIRENSMLYVAMRKTVDEPFAIPMQGIYSNSLSKEAQLAWSELR